MSTPNVIGFLSLCALLLFVNVARAEDCDGGAHLDINTAGPYVLHGKIDGGCIANITAQTIQITGKIDNPVMRATLTATGGGVTIGERIDGGAQVTIRAEGPISIADKIDNGATRVNWCAPGFTVPHINPDSPDGSRRHLPRAWKSWRKRGFLFHPLPGSLSPVQTCQTIEIEGKFASSTRKRQSHPANPGSMVVLGQRKLVAVNTSF